MTFNSQEIIQDVRAEFEHLLDFVTGEQARTAKADNCDVVGGCFNRAISVFNSLISFASS